MNQGPCLIAILALGQDALQSDVLKKLPQVATVEAKPIDNLFRTLTFLFAKRPMRERLRALSIRQPHAEAIVRGTKPIEFRTRATRIRGRILVYASQGRYSAADEADMMDEYGIDDVSCDDLPRGVLVATVELYDCDGGDWYVRNPQRLIEPIEPAMHPQPVWFYPFETVEQTPDHLLTALTQEPSALNRTESNQKQRSKLSSATDGARPMSKYAQGWMEVFGRR